MVMFIATMLIFGTIGVLRRYIPLPSALLAFSRGILGGIFLLVISRIRKGASWKEMKCAALVRLVITGALIGINWMMLFEAFNRTTVAVATLCYYMQPTIVILLSPILFRERLTLRKGLCAAVSIIGMVLVSGVIGNSSETAGNTQGVLLALGAALIYAGVVITNKIFPQTDTYLETSVMLLSAGIIMLPYLLLTNGFRTGEISVFSILLLFILGVFHTGFAYTLFFDSMHGLRAQTIAVFSYIDPASTLLFSSFVL